MSTTDLACTTALITGATAASAKPPPSRWPIGAPMCSSVAVTPRVRGVVARSRPRAAKQTSLPPISAALTRHDRSLAGPSNSAAANGTSGQQRRHLPHGSDPGNWRRRTSTPHSPSTSKCPLSSSPSWLRPWLLEARAPSSTSVSWPPNSGYQVCRSAGPPRGVARPETVKRRAALRPKSGLRQLVSRRPFKIHCRGVFPGQWSPLTESNRRPSPYHGDALPTELRGRPRHAATPASQMEHRARRAYTTDDRQVRSSLTAVALNAAGSVGQAADSGSMTSKWPQPSLRLHVTSTPLA